MGSGFSACQSPSTVHVQNSLRSLREPETRRNTSRFPSGRGAHVNVYGNGRNSQRRTNDFGKQKHLPDQRQRKIDVEDLCEEEREEEAPILNRSSLSLNLTSSNGWSKGSLETTAGLSDSCDSGISEGNRKRSLQTSENSRFSGTENVSASDSNDNNSSGKSVKTYGDHPANLTGTGTSNPGFLQDTRYNRPISKPGTMRSNRRSAPNLMQLAIDEADEDDEAVRNSRPTRPKTAYIRKRSGHAVPSAKRTKTASSKGSNDWDSTTEFSDDGDFDSDEISIPDETRVEITPRGPDGVTSVKLGPKFNTVTHAGPDNVDWWTAVPHLEDDEDGLTALYSARSQSSIAARLRDDGDCGIGKKASERSISSVILLSPLDAFDPACISRASSISSPSFPSPSASSSLCPFCRTTNTIDNNDRKVCSCPIHSSRDTPHTASASVDNTPTTTPRRTKTREGDIESSSEYAQQTMTSHHHQQQQQKLHCLKCTRPLSPNRNLQIDPEPKHHETNDKNSNANSNITHSECLLKTTAPDTSSSSNTQIKYSNTTDPMCNITTTTSTNHVCFALSLTNIFCRGCLGPNNPPAHLLSAHKNLQELDQHIYTELLGLSQKSNSNLGDYQTIVRRSRSRFLHVISGLKTEAGPEASRLEESMDTVTLQMVEERLAQTFYTSRNHVHPGSVSAHVLGHLLALERLCDVRRSKPIRIEVGSKMNQGNTTTISKVENKGHYRHALWEESGVEDEGNASDLSDEESSKECQVNGGPTSRYPVSRDKNQPLGEGNGDKSEDCIVTGLPPRGNQGIGHSDSAMTTMPRVKTGLRRMPSEQGSVISGSDVKAKLNQESKGKQRPDSGIVVSSSASYSSSEATRDTDSDVTSQTEWIAKSLEMLQDIYRVRTEDHDTMKSLVKAITVKSDSDQLKAHALYRWLSSQSLPYYSKFAQSTKTSSPSGKMKQLSDGKTSYASLYQEMARAAGLKCEKIDGYAKGKDYMPGTPSRTAANQHSWNAISFNGHYALVDAKFGSLPYKFFVEHYFMTPPDEFRLSHYPKDKKWLMMTQGISQEDFDNTLKVWPTMVAFNIRPLNMRSVLRTYDGRLSITVLLRSVAVTPHLDYRGPGPELDSDNLALNIDQEIRSSDNAETFHISLPQEGTYFFTLMVHDVEEDEDIPVFQNRIEYSDELL